MQQIIFGYKEIENCLQKAGCKRIMLVCGRSFDNSFLKEYIESLHYDFVKFSDFQSNPLYENVCEGVQLFRKSQCDGLLAIGGGSAIDVAKCIKLYVGMPDTELYFKQNCIDSKIPLIAVPTTAGTGSESTRFAVIYYDGNKQSISHTSIIPDYAILEPKVLENLPLYQKKCTLMDAFCQAIESWWSVNATDESKSYSKKAIELIISNWEKYINEKYDTENALNIIKAANFAGKAINISQTTAAHAFSYKITSMYGLPHGHAVAVCLPEIWEFMKESHLDVFKDISNAMQCDGNVDVAINKFRDMMKIMGLYKPLSKELVDDIDKLSKSVNPIRLKNNPIEISVEDAKMIYSKIITD